jgi:hypothetical protein
MGGSYTTSVENTTRFLSERVPNVIPSEESLSPFRTVTLSTFADPEQGIQTLTHEFTHGLTTAAGIDDVKAAQSQMDYLKAAILNDLDNVIAQKESGELASLGGVKVGSRVQNLTEYSSYLQSRMNPILMQIAREEARADTGASLISHMTDLTIEPELSGYAAVKQGVYEGYIQGTDTETMLQSLLKSHPEYPSLQPLEQDELIRNFTLDVKMKSNAEYLTSLGEVNGNYQNQVGDVIRKNFEYIRSEAGTMRRSSG